MQPIRRISRAFVLVLAALLAPSAGCESAPCETEACAEVCSGDDCATGSAPGGSGAGRYSKCSSDANCDTTHGFRCAGGNCLYACSSHFDCAGIGQCQDVTTSSGTAAFCVPDPAGTELGRYYSNCPSTTECDAAAGFFCRGSGAGDLDSYCTSQCAADQDCPTGFLCETVSATPCEDACDVSGDENDPDCVPLSEIGIGKRYSCGPTGPEQNICVKRRFCAECETNEDCRAVPDLVCARDEGGAKICTPRCDPALNSCPWGNAASCGVWDAELGVPTCSHRFGACQGSGAPCEPCFRQADCGATGICYGSSFTGERYCVDLSVDCSCAGETVSGGVCQGGGCPLTPGGLTMMCYVGNTPSAPGICLGADANEVQNPLLGNPQTGCWGQP